MMANALPTRDSRTQPGETPDAVRIETCQPGDAAAWDEYVGRHPAGTFYHLHAWSELNRAALGHRSYYLLARDARGIRGVLPLTFVSSRLFGRILCSLPFVNYGGPCADDEPTARALIAAAVDQAGKLGADTLELRCAEAQPTDLTVSHRKISMSLSLANDPDAVWNAFSSKQRTNIRRSYKNELAVHSGGRELLPVFYSVMAQSWRSLGTPLYAPDYFERILDAFGDRARIFVCHRNQEPVAVAFNGYFNGTVEGMWAGGTAQSRALQANYVLYWEMIKDACERGFARYHLGRSTADSGAEDFKKKWNATSRQLHWYYHTRKGGEMPSLNVDNPKYRLAISAWQRLPLWATRLVGPRIARLIP
jgi:FemAB-related protein (PEP-CTERM system-associated)